MSQGSFQSEEDGGVAAQQAAIDLLPFFCDPAAGSEGCSIVCVIVAAEVLQRRAFAYAPVRWIFAVAEQHIPHRMIAVNSSRGACRFPEAKPVGDNLNSEHGIFGLRQFGELLKIGLPLL
ncbi:hypothetical protein SDC9_138354 [bioreactor metagenome]|uniref:Uncharacterized protein n=1 Tax=bioreactor metagenome TaxID=1076179 RepID=A0A645DPH8_9ZZZZ